LKILLFKLINHLVLYLICANYDLGNEW
jgi:hypothetical protein